MKVFWKYKEDDSTALLNEIFAGLLPAGVYTGYDATLGSSMILTLSHHNAFVETDLAGNQIKRGVIRTKQGVLIAEEDNVSFNITPTGSQGRIDVVYLQHQYQQLISAPMPFYGILEGTPSANPTPPNLTSPFHVKIGELLLPPNCTSLNQAVWIKEPSPLLYRGIDRYDLRSSKISYVEAQRRTNQPLVGGTNLVSWQSETDDLNEFNTTNSEFVAQMNGIYQFNATVRVNITNTSFMHAQFDYWNGLVWDVIAMQGRGSVGIQGEDCVSVCKKLNAGERVRFLVGVGGTGYSDLIYAFLSIARIG